MSTFWAVIIAFLAGEVLGIIGMAILSGWLDKRLEKEQKKSR